MNNKVNENVENMSLSLSSKEGALQAIARLQNFFSSYEGEYNGFNDLTIIDVYVRHLSIDAETYNK